MMKACRYWSLVLVLLLTPAIQAQESPVKAASQVTAGPTDAQLSQSLKDALSILKQVEDAVAKEVQAGEESVAVLLFDERKIGLLREIGKAQALVGDAEIARKTWQSAIDLILAETFVPRRSSRAELLLSVAEAQREVKSVDAVATLSQAAEAAREMLNDDEKVSLRSDEGDPLVTRAEMLIQIGLTFSKIEQLAAARQLFGEALESIEQVKDPVERVQALSYLAAKQNTPDSVGTWEKATRAALDVEDTYKKYCAVENILRSRVQVGQNEEAIRLITESLKGELKAFGLWCVVDAISYVDAKVDPTIIERLLEITGKLEFDRDTKKRNAYLALAHASARMGREEDAYRILRLIQPATGPMKSREDQTRVEVMLTLARAQIAGEQRPAAKSTLQSIWEIVTPYIASGEGWRFVLGEIAELRVLVGDLDGARKSIAVIDRGESSVEALAALAVAEAERGDAEAAGKTIAEAYQQISRVNIDALWDLDQLRRHRDARDSDSKHKSESREFAKTPERDLGLTIWHLSLNKVAVAQAKIGKVDDAVRMVSTGIVNKELAVPVAAIETLAKIARIQTSGRQFIGAFATVDAIPDFWLDLEGNTKNKLLEETAKAQSGAGDVKAVLDRAAKTESGPAKISLLTGLAEGISAQKKVVAPNKARAEKGS